MTSALAMITRCLRLGKRKARENPSMLEKELMLSEKLLATYGCRERISFHQECGH